MAWSKTKNVWSTDPADTLAEQNIHVTNMLASTWGTSTPASSKEDAAVHRIIADRIRELVRRLGNSGYATTGVFSFSSGYPANAFQDGLGRVVVDGLTATIAGVGLNSDTANQYTLPAPPASGTRQDLVYLEVFLVEVPGSTTSLANATNKPDAAHVFKWGNVLYGGTNVVDDINEVNYEIRRRVQVQYRVRTVAGVNVTAHPNGVDDGTTVFAQGPQAAPTALTFADAPADAGLYVAGNGSVAHQSTLGTLDGYVYAVPMAMVNRSAGQTQINQGDVTDLRKAWGGVSAGDVLTTKGDLLGFATSPARLPVGTNGQTLEADSTAATGLSWKQPPQGLYGFRGLQGSATGSTQTASWTVNELIAETALGGTAYKGANLSLSFNGATIGAGGMDTGVLSTSAASDLAVYAIYNPTTNTWSTLGQVQTGAVPPQLYGGASLPAGYTASVLIWSGITTAGGDIMPFDQRERIIYLPGTPTIASSLSAASATSLSLGSVIPRAATAVAFNAVLSGVGPSNLFIGPTAAAVAQLMIWGYSSSGGTSPFVQLETAQRIYYSVTAGATWNVLQGYAYTI